MLKGPRKGKAAKMSFRNWFRVLNRDYSNPLTLLNVGELSWTGISLTICQFRKKKKTSSSIVYGLYVISNKREIKHFHVVVKWRNVWNSMMHVQSFCFADVTYCFSLSFLLPSSLLDLKVTYACSRGLKGAGESCHLFWPTWQPWLFLKWKRGMRNEELGMRNGGREAGNL